MRTTSSRFVRRAVHLHKRMVASLAARPLLHVVVLAVAVLVMLLAGALFLPLASGADEAAHYVYSAAVVRGQAGTLQPTIPAQIDVLHRFAGCIAFQPDVTAVCQRAELVSSHQDVTSQTNAGLYNPTFYAFVGLGSLIDPTASGLYLARALAALVSATFLGWGLSLLWRTASTAWPTLAAFLLLTPMTVYLGSVLNPSAWEISTAFAFTVAGWNLLRGASAQRGWTEANTLTAVAGSVLVVTRGLSPVILLLGGLILAVAVGWSSFAAALARRWFWLTLAPIAAASIYAVSWIATHGTNYVGVEKPASLRDGLGFIAVFHATYVDQIMQMYGVLGWLDLPSPQVLVFGWLLIVGAFLIASMSASTRRTRVAIVIAFAVCVMMPAILAGIQWSGRGWQGRYTLPLVAVLLIVCGLGADRMFAIDTSPSALTSKLLGTMRFLVLGIFLVGTTTMTIITIHRYSVGQSAPFLAEASWVPPIPGGWLLALFAVGLAALLLIAGAAPPLQHPRPAAHVERINAQ